MKCSLCCWHHLQCLSSGETPDCKGSEDPQQDKDKIIFKNKELCRLSWGPTQYPFHFLSYKEDLDFIQAVMCPDSDGGS